MKLSDVLSMLGGLALFLYGMNMMSDGLEQAAGNRMKDILERLTSNRFLGVLVGALITALIQSSSATTVMTVGFVNSGIMSLESAVWIIMGANIGTTITGQLVATNITELAPLIAFVGVFLIIFFKNSRVNAVGKICGGLGILFIGMNTMSEAMSPLREWPAFVEVVSTFENPLIGILVGAGFTALIQSSSASVGILQALARSGVITLPSAIYVLYGQNIGTCITAVIASIGGNRNAKRTTVIHLLFNIIGTTLFVTISLLTPFTASIEALTPNNVTAQIANVHTLFNVVTTIVLLPFGTYLVKIAYMILPKYEVSTDVSEVKYLDFTIFDNDFHIGTVNIMHTQLINEIGNMLEVAISNVKKSFHLISDYSDIEVDKIRDNEKYINYLNHQIVEYTTKAIAQENSLEDSLQTGIFLRIANDIERIASYSLGIAMIAKQCNDNNYRFSDDEKKEIKEYRSLCLNLLYRIQSMDDRELNEIIDEKNEIETQFEDVNHKFAVNQLMRLREKESSTEKTILYNNLMNYGERIEDHCLSLTRKLLQVSNNSNQYSSQISSEPSNSLNN